MVSLAATSKLSNLDWRQLLADEELKLGNYKSKKWRQAIESVEKVAQAAFQEIKRIWGYLKKGLALAKSVLQIIGRTCASTSVAIAKALSRIKFIAILTMLFNLKSIVDDFKELTKSAKLKHYEAVLDTSLILSMDGLEFVDGGITLTSAIFDLHANILPKFFGIVGTPIGYLLAILGSLQRSFKIMSIRETLKEFRKEQLKLQELLEGNEENPQEALKEIKEFINKKIGLTDSDQKYIKKLVDRRKKKKGEKASNRDYIQAMARYQLIKERKISRNISPKACENFKKLRDIFNLYSSSYTDEKQKNLLEIANQTLKSSRSIGMRKIILNVIGIATNVITVVALSLIFTPLTPLVPIGILLGLAVIKLGIHVYEDIFLNRNFKKSDFSVFNLHESSLEKPCAA